MKQVQSKSSSKNEVTCKNPLHFDMEIPIAIRKETKECTKHSLYLILSLLSFHKGSPSHKIMSLNIEFIRN